MTGSWSAARRALADGAWGGHSEHEVEFERRLEQVIRALGEAHVELRLLRCRGAGADTVLTATAPPST